MENTPYSATLHQQEGLAMSEPRTGRLDDASAAAVYIVSYVEVRPPSTAESIALLRQYREASRDEAGNTCLEVLQQHGRPDHFAILERWRDEQTCAAHGVAAHTQQCREQLRPLCVSPCDERLHHGLTSGATLAARLSGATYVVTHADAIPPARDEAAVLLQQLAAASRVEAGNLHFEILQQRSRQNHFTVVEIWQNQPAREAHVMTAHTRQFRDQFQPMSGSLYDERLYQALG
jgi:quinol monooxygenase YgiN